MKIDLYEGAFFELPKIPERKNILGFDLEKKDQKWINVRVSLPKNWSEFDDDQQEAFADEENRKCREGEWFLNNGYPTYITGDQYFYLTWFNIDEGLPDYRDRDRRWFYHWQLCYEDAECIGQQYGKLRRDGYTFRVLAIILNSARKSFNKNYGMVSNTGSLSKKCFRKLNYSFRKLPAFMKPQVESSEKIQGSLTFGTPPVRVSNKNKKSEDGIGLDTTIDWQSTSETAYDGTKQRFILGDEVGKWLTANAENWLNVAQTCVMLGRKKIVGKIFFGSTVEESKKGGQAFLNVWENSCFGDRTDNNRTTSGLYRYFCPAYDGLESFIDEYGISVIDTPTKPVRGIDGDWITVGAKEYLENERKDKKKKGDTIGYFQLLRQFPFTEDEMFTEKSTNAAFDIEKILQQISYTKVILDTNPSLMIQGNFTWKDGKRDSEVAFNHDSNGKWLLSWLPKLDDRNKKVTKFGKPAPANTHAGIITLDPFDHKTTTSGKQSKAGAHGYRKLDLMDSDNSDCFVSEYWGRPSDPSVLYEDMLIQCVFFGWEILGENNKPGCMTHFRNRGYENYLSDRPAITHTEYSEKHQSEKWLPTSGEAARQTLIENLQSYIYTHIGLKSDGKMGNCLFLNTLNDWLKFNAGKWTDYDLTVSSMLAVVGSRKYVPSPTKRKIGINDLFPSRVVQGGRTVSKNDGNSVDRDRYKGFYKT